jgi:hypothetical protein
MNIFRHQNDSKLTDRQNLSTPQISGQLRSQRLRRRYGTELLGALLFVGAIVAFNSYTDGSASQGAKTPSSTTHSSSVESTTVTPDTPAAVPAGSGNAIISQEGSSMSASANNNVDTQVTVNGVDVPVPVNGSSQQTVVGDGSPTSVSISHSQSTTGHASNTNHISTHLNVSTTTRSNDSTTESRSGTP